MSANLPPTEDVVPEWPQCDPDLMIPLLKKLPLEEIPTNRKFYSSYPAFTVMTDDQKNKTLAFYNVLSDVSKGVLVALCKAESQKERVKAVARYPQL